MSADQMIKKPKEKHVNKTQSTSNFFKPTNKPNKKKVQLSHVEIGVPDPIEEQQKVLGRPTPCTVLAVSTTLFILILLIIALGELGLHDASAFKWIKKPDNHTRKQIETPCETIECVRYSAELLESMNSSVDPCVNFHEHVCSGFTPRKRSFEKLLKLTLSQTNSDHHKAVKVVRKMLSKCALAESKDRNHREQLGTIISSKLPFPIFSINWPLPFVSTVSTMLSNSSDDSNSTEYHHSLTDILIHISQHTPEDTGLFGLTPSTDSEFSLFVVKPNTPSLTLYQLRNVVDILKRHIPDDVMNSTGYSEEEWNRQLNDVQDLQEKLKDVQFVGHPELISLDDIQMKMNLINWTTLVESWYKSNENNTLEGKVFGFNSTYYEEVNDILTSTPSETVYNLLFLRFAFIFLRSELSSELEETCLQQISQTVPGKIVLHGSAEPGTTELFHRMRKTIGAHMRTSLSQMAWMEPMSIEIALEKLGRTKTVFGFDGEDLIDELDITLNSSYAATLSHVFKWQTENMFKSIAENTVSIFLNAEVFYSVPKNEITISRSLLHYPFISSRLPNYTNFATVASKILPQLIHIFDERGRFYDENGKQRDWWNSRTEENFRVVLKCFDEMMQNVFGVSMSLGWNSYDSTKEPYAVLPGFQKNTDYELFFYSLVKTMCSSNPAKVNEALASVPQFISAFKCQYGNGTKTRPNPRSKFLCKMAV
ncbi:unnamed protein product [Caenorhabditis brenneri]